MNQDQRESLSAVMDGEGDELSLPRVLKSLEGNDEMADQWRRYHVARSIMKRERDIDVSMDISAAVRQRIEQEPMVDQAETAKTETAKTERTGRRHAPFSFMGSAAIAAAVSLMVITGVQVFRGGDDVGSGTSLPGSNDFALQDASVQGGEGASRLRTNVSLVSLPIFESGAEAKSGPIRVNASTPWMTEGSANDSDDAWAQYLSTIPSDQLNRMNELAPLRAAQ
ncbi:sigma-E factor negative regulatory protein [Larsenimonas salina]|uniref:sigma-E factor negative regulatory protein n=1 Tax=Larsenimonas salina TaxID=1295565 RepID=UPI00207409A6|nr:sigma-E factor negative regulatory protein [Larsenimonas salina]MCM5703253.1 sigma-E factor negative regulatory protein [Larsenimonas salina]